MNDLNIEVPCKCGHIKLLHDSNNSHCLMVATTIAGLFCRCKEFKLDNIGYLEWKHKVKSI